MKKIWIVNYYATPPEYSSNPRHNEFAYHLRKAGYDVTIISASYLMRKNIDLISDEKKYMEVKHDEQKYVHIKVRRYIGNGIGRMISIFQFAWRLFRLRKRFERPDTILHNIHAPFDYPVVWCAEKLKAEYIAEAWDLWPDSFIRFGLIGERNPLVKIAFAIERKMYEKADKIIFSFEGGIDYLREKKWTKELGGKIDTPKVFYINNGVNLEKYYADMAQYPLDDHDLNDDSFFKVIYLGSIRLVNNVKDLIDAANILKTNPKIKILIYGDGTDMPYLLEYCKKKKIDNVIFNKKWIPLRNVPYVLSRSSLNILNYKKNFGIYGVSSGKLFQYLASGKPICANIKMNYCIIEKNRLGIAKDFKTPEEYAEAILSIASLDQASYKAMCNRVNEMAKTFDYTVLSEKLIKIMES